VEVVVVLLNLVKRRRHRQDVWELVAVEASVIHFEEAGILLLQLGTELRVDLPVFLLKTGDAVADILNVSV
jgi:hypothetical protein